MKNGVGDALVCDGLSWMWEMAKKFVVTCGDVWAHGETDVDDFLKNEKFSI